MQIFLFLPLLQLTAFLPFFGLTAPFFAYHVTLGITTEYYRYFRRSPALYPAELRAHETAGKAVL